MTGNYLTNPETDLRDALTRAETKSEYYTEDEDDDLFGSIA